MTSHVDLVPKWIRAALGVLAVANIAFGAMGYADTSLLFHGGHGLDLTNPLLREASFEFAARNLAIGLALGIVASKGVPESIAIVTIIRALIELQTVIITVAQGKADALLLVPLAVLVGEVFIVKTLVGVIARRDAR